MIEYLCRKEETTLARIESENCLVIELQKWQDELDLCDTFDEVIYNTLDTVIGMIINED